MRVKFDDIFDTSAGVAVPRVMVSVGGVTISPGATMSATGEFLSGINLDILAGHDDEITADKIGAMTITAYY